MRQVLVGTLGQPHPLHHDGPPDPIREDPGEERCDRAAHGVADHHQFLPCDGVRQVEDVVEVVEEVVVPAGPDPLRVAVAPEIGGDHVIPGLGQGGGDGREAPRQVEEAVEAEEGGLPTAVPLQEVVAKAVGGQFPLHRTRVAHAGGGYLLGRTTATVRAVRRPPGYEPAMRLT
jgi:hypothetical protein